MSFSIIIGVIFFLIIIFIVVIKNSSKVNKNTEIVNDVEKKFKNKQNKYIKKLRQINKIQNHKSFCILKKDNISNLQIVNVDWEAFDTIIKISLSNTLKTNLNKYYFYFKYFRKELNQILYINYKNKSYTMNKDKTINITNLKKKEK